MRNKNGRHSANIIPLDFKRERFFNKIESMESGKCWEWIGGKATGYGRFNIGGRIYQAHRVSAAIARGQLESSLVLDHICMNRACVNPEHLREVSAGKNIIENSTSPAAKNKKKPHCVNGHNLKDSYVNKKGHRKCKQCHRADWAKRKLRKAEEQKVAA